MKITENNKRLKIVRRIGMPETNSSSSHAVSISMNPTSLVAPGDKDWDIEITEDGILRIPGGKEFGWEYFKTNSILTKLQYLCGIYCYDIRTDHGKKSITKLKKILKRIFGVRDVEFLWITEFSERLKEVEDPDDAYYAYPEIDHNSHDIFEEITENESVIRAFLLSRDSWLYGGNDNSDAPEGFYNEPISISRVNAILSVELGGKIGRVDWEVKNLFDQVGKDTVKRTLTNDDDFNVLLEEVATNPTDDTKMLGKITKHTNHPITMNEVLCLQTIKATPHDPCASDATSIFLSDCLNSTQEGWRLSRRIWEI